MPRAILAFVLCGSPLWGADLLVSYAPDSMDVTQSVYGTKSLGTWTIRACNVSAATVGVAAERILQEGRGIPFLERERALNLLLRARKKSKSTYSARALRWTTVAGTLALTTYTRANAKAIALAAGVSTMLEGVAREVEASGPLTISKDEILDGRYTLEPGACITRTAFASKMRGARFQEREIDLPSSATPSLTPGRRPAVSQLTAIIL